ncbi:helix-turn-helix domain-containing protein [Rhizobium sp. N113]|nr:helix-turn-helix domain-containing protein [Rhizobium sp. N113]
MCSSCRGWCDEEPVNLSLRPWAIARGLSLREVAMADDISYETLRTHLRNIYAKLGVNSRVRLVSLLMR